MRSWRSRFAHGWRPLKCWLGHDWVTEKAMDIGVVYRTCWRCRTIQPGSVMTID